MLLLLHERWHHCGAGKCDPPPVVDLTYMHAAACGCHAVRLSCESAAKACSKTVVGLIEVFLRWSRI